MPELIISLPTSFKNVVIGNGGSAFVMYAFMEGVQFRLHSPFLIITRLVHFQALMFNLDFLLDCWEVWYVRYANHPFNVSVIHILRCTLSISHYYMPCSFSSFDV